MYNFPQSYEEPQTASFPPDSASSLLLFHLAGTGCLIPILELDNLFSLLEISSSLSAGLTSFAFLFWFISLSYFNTILYFSLLESKLRAFEKVLYQSLLLTFFVQASPFHDASWYRTYMTPPTPWFCVIFSPVFISLCCAVPWHI